MNVNYINSENFDLSFSKLLRKPKRRNAVVGRFDIEGVRLAEKSELIFRMLLSFREIGGITCKVLFWEADMLISNFFELNNKRYKITTSYRNGKLPGVLFWEDKIVDELFLKQLLHRHFNYEMAKEPAFNVRVQICVNHKEASTLFDIYDDRGFFVYYVIHKNERLS